MEATPKLRIELRRISVTRVSVPQRLWPHGTEPPHVWDLTTAVHCENLSALFKASTIARRCCVTRTDGRAVRVALRSPGAAQLSKFAPPGTRVVYLRSWANVRPPPLCSTTSCRCATGLSPLSLRHSGHGCTARCRMASSSPKCGGMTSPTAELLLPWLSCRWYAWSCRTQHRQWKRPHYSQLASRAVAVGCPCLTCLTWTRRCAGGCGCIGSAGASGVNSKRSDHGWRSDWRARPPLFGWPMRERGTDGTCCTLACALGTWWRWICSGSEKYGSWPCVCGIERTCKGWGRTLRAGPQRCGPACSCCPLCMTRAEHLRPCESGKL